MIFSRSSLNSNFAVFVQFLLCLFSLRDRFLSFVVARPHSFIIPSRIVLMSVQWTLDSPIPHCVRWEEVHLTFHAARSALIFISTLCVIPNPINSHPKLGKFPVGSIDGVFLLAIFVTRLWVIGNM